MRRYTQAFNPRHQVQNFKRDIRAFGRPLCRDMPSLSPGINLVISHLDRSHLYPNPQPELETATP